MNGKEQRQHTTVTTAIAKDLEALTTEWEELFAVASDRLTLHQAQLADTFRDRMALRVELDRLDETLRLLHAKLLAQTEPLRRGLWGRVEWVLTGH